MADKVEYWEHSFAYARDGYVYSQISPGGTMVPDPPGWSFPMRVEEYIVRMGESGDGYQFCGSYPYRDGVAIVMKKLRNA
jgi:hypothetical protein